MRNKRLKKAKDKPQSPLDFPSLKSLGRVQSTEEEAANYFGISVEHFRKILETEDDDGNPSPEKVVWDRARAKGRLGLRKKQFRLAGSQPMMAKFLGKNYLEQKETITNEHSGPDGKEIPLGVTVQFVSPTEPTKKESKKPVKRRSKKKRRHARKG